MAVVEGSSDGHDRTSKRRPFSSWMKKIAQFKVGDPQQHNTRRFDRTLGISRQKKAMGFNNKNDPYPETGRAKPTNPLASARSTNRLSLSSPVHSRTTNDSCDSLSGSTTQGGEGLNGSNRSGAPTVATDLDTIHSETAQSRTATTATDTGALSAAGAGSTFSSPNHSDQSLTTTLTTIYSQSQGVAQQHHLALQNPHTHTHVQISNHDPVMFSHQYPISPAHSTYNTISAIPRHMNEAVPSTYASATANNLLSDNASILTLASSSKRRRRSLESHTDASVRAIPPSSIWSGSRESLPLGVLSGGPEVSFGPHSHNHNRPSVGGLTSTERASIYSSQGVTAPALASERNSYYAVSQKQAAKDLGDAKSLRSFTNMDARSQYDTRSINDAKSADLSSLRNYEGSIRSGALGHGRNDSGSGNGNGAIAASSGPRYSSTMGGLSRRSSDWQDPDERDK